MHDMTQTSQQKPHSMGPTEISIAHATVTEKQHDVLSRLSAGRTAIEVAEELKIVGNGVAARLKGALLRVGLVPLLKEYPGAAAALLKADAKLQNKSAPGIVEREIPDKIESKDLLNAVQEKLCLALSYIDSHNIATSKLSEINSTIKTLFDIQQVMQGKPTSISASENTKALKDLVPALMREAQRRGIVTIEGEVIEVREPEPARRKTRKSGNPPKGVMPPQLQAYRDKVRSAKGSKDAVSKRSADTLTAAIEGFSAPSDPPTWADGVGVSDPGPVSQSAPSDFSKLIEDM